MKKTVTLTEAEWAALDAFLEELGDHQSNAGCNDLPKSIRDKFGRIEGEILANEYAKYNNEEEPEGPSWPLPDFCLLSLLQHKIKKQLG